MIVIRGDRRVVVSESEFRREVVAGSFEGKTLANTGGKVLLPAAALFLGSGVLTYAILRRRF